MNRKTKIFIMEYLPLIISLITIITTAIVMGTIGCALVLKSLNASEVWLDAYTLVAGIASPILVLFAFIENLPLAFIGQIITLIMWVKIAFGGNIANITYVILSVYNTYMTVRMIITWIKLYKEQQKLKQEKENS